MAKAPRGAFVDKLWREALRRAVMRRAEGEPRGRRLDRIAESVVSQAEGGKLEAAQEIGNRLDGKASQPIEHSGHLDVAMTLDRVITEMREREQSMRVDDVVRH